MRLGFDVGGTKTDAVAVAPGGEIVARIRKPTGWGAQAVVAAITSGIGDLATDLGCSPAEFRSIGVGIPGQVAPGTATVTHAVNLGVDELDLAATVAPELGVPVRVENDVNAAAVGAYALHGRARSMAYLNLGTGVAAGIVTDGELWRGARGAAGEVGHVSVDPNGPECRCGQRGCIEAFAGGGAIAAGWTTSDAFPVRAVFDAADAGDTRALRLRTGLAYGVAAAVRVLVLTADVDVVVLGGGLTGLGDRLLTTVHQALATNADASPFIRSLQLLDRVELLPPGSPAAALGAAIIGADRDPREVPAYG